MPIALPRLAVKSSRRNPERETGEHGDVLKSSPSLFVVLRKIAEVNQRFCFHESCYLAVTSRTVNA